MTTRVITSPFDMDRLLLFLSQQKIPFTVEITKGAHRSVAQNKLQRLWLNEVAEQLGDRTPEEVRGYCKLILGVPILRAENETFRERYDAIVRPLPYEAKLAIMMEPLDMPVTRLMSTDQTTRFLDAMHRQWAEQGLVLTDPDPMRSAA